MHDFGVQHCTMSGSATLRMVLVYNTVRGHRVHHCAWSWSKTLCMVMECNTVHGIGVQHCA